MSLRRIPRHSRRGGRALLGVALLAAGTATLFVSAPGGAEAGTPATTEGGPSLAPPPTLGEYDFGVIAGEQVVTGELRVRNDGDVAWDVLKESVECGCTKILSVEPRSVEPGDELVVKLQLDSTGRGPGPQLRGLSIVVGPEPQRIEGHVRAYLVTRPEAAGSVLVAELAPGVDDWSSRTVLHAPDLDLASRVEITSAPEGVDVEVGPGELEDGLVCFPVTVSGTLPQDEGERTIDVTARVFVERHFEEGVDIPLRIHARRRDPLRVSPGRVVLREGATGAAHLFVRNDGGDPAGDLTVRAEPAGLVEVEIDADRGQLTVSLAEGASGDRGTLVVESTDGHRRELPIRIVE